MSVSSEQSGFISLSVVQFVHFVIQGILNNFPHLFNSKATTFLCWIFALQNIEGWYNNIPSAKQTCYCRNLGLHPCVPLVSCGNLWPTHITNWLKGG